MSSIQNPQVSTTTAIGIGGRIVGGTVGKVLYVGNSSGQPIVAQGDATDVIGGFTPGSIIFAGADGTLDQNNSVLFFDSTNLTIGLGGTRSGAISATNSKVRIKGAGSTSSTSAFGVVNSSDTNILRLLDSGNFGLGATPNANIHINAFFSFTDVSSISYGFYQRTNFISSLADITVTQQGINSDVTLSYAASGRTISGAISAVRSFAYIATANHLGTIDDLRAYMADYGIASPSGGGQVTNATGIRLVLQRGGTGSMTTTYGVYLTETGSTATVTTKYGFYESMASGTINRFNNRVVIGAATPTALLHLGAGTATANTAPLKFTSGTNLTTGETGAMEYDGTNLFFTPTGTTRQSILMSATVTTESVASDTTVTVNIGGTTYKLLARA